MRITNNMMVNTLMRNLTQNMNRMSVYQDQLATGKRVIRASDDPVGTSKILKFKSDIRALEQYEKNAGDSLAWLEVTESSIADTGHVLQRMRELAVQAANGTNTADDTKKIAAEIQQMKRHLIGNGNFSYAGRYAFSGYQTDMPLFNDDGTYRINITSVDITQNAQLQYQVSVAQDMEVTTHGISVFGYTLIDNVMTQRFPDGEVRGAGATKGVLKGTLDLSGDLSGLDPADEMTITVDGTAYTLTGLQLSALRAPIDGQKVLTIVGGAENAGPPVTTLAANADVFLDASGALTIKSRTAGAASSVSVSYTSLIPGNIPAMESVFGLPDGASATGTNATDAVITGTGILDDAAIASDPAAFENQKFLVTYNGNKIEVAIGSPAPTDQAGLLGIIQPQLDAAFGTGNVTAGFDGGNQLYFSGAPKAADGDASILEVRTIRATQSQLMADIDDYIAALNSGDSGVVGAFLGKVDDHMNRILSVRADIGARYNRLELIANRISDNIISYTTMLSDAQDADMGGVIMFLKNAENVYKAALSTGAKVIQPSLIDFLR